MPAVLSGSDRDNPRPTTSSGTRGARHLQIHCLVSDPDDRHVGHLGLDVAFRGGCYAERDGGAIL